MTSTRTHPTAIGLAATARESGSFIGTATFASLAMLISYLPFSLTNGALGAIATTTGADTHQLQWVTDAFTVALTGAILSGGSLAARFGRRRVTSTGLVLTALSGLIGLGAGTTASGDTMVHLLWVGQAVGGAGAGLVMSSTLALITTTAPTAEARTRAISVWAGANVVGLGVGPFLVAGATTLIKDPVAWRWAFIPVLVLAAGVVALGPVASRETSDATAGRADLAGQALGALSAVTIVYSAISGGSNGWSDPRTLVGATLALVLLVAFVGAEQHAPSPSVPLSLIRSRSFVSAALAAAMVLFTVIGTVFVLSLFLTARGASSLDIALVIGSLFAGNALASVASSALQGRFGSGTVVLGGLALAVLGVVTLLSIDTDTTLGGLAVRLAILGAGCGTVVAGSTVLAVQSAPAQLAAAAGTVNNVLRQLGGALGAAVLGGVLATRLAGGADIVSAAHTSLTVLLVVLAGCALVCLALLHTGRARPTDTGVVAH